MRNRGMCKTRITGSKAAKKGCPHRLHFDFWKRLIRLSSLGYPKLKITIYIEIKLKKTDDDWAEFQGVSK